MKEEKKKTIAIYGGSFNPIHNGHTGLAASLVEQGLVDEVWLLVSPLNPLKQDTASHIAPFHHRMRMAELATADIAGVRVSDFESHLPTPSYTITTLQALEAAYPQHRFTLVVGADNWASFNRWYRADDIIARYPIIVYPRPGFDIDPALLPPTVTLATTPLYPISSTEIRVGQGHDFLHPKVADYIRKKHLYNY